MSDPIVKVEGTEYRIGKLDVFDQFHIARRLAPLLATLGTALLDRPVVSLEGDTAKESSDRFLSLALSPLAEAIAKMSNADADFIIHTCLAVCYRKVDPQGWAPVQVNGKTLAYDDITLTILMGLVVNVIEENLGSFFPIKRLESPPTAKTKSNLPV